MQTAEDRDAATAAQMRDDLMSGAYFTRHAVGHRSRRLGGPPVAREAWAHATETVARMARTSDALAQVARALLPLPLYQTGGELAAALYEAARQALWSRYDDVIGRTGPEAGRPSQYVRDWTLQERVLIAAYLAEAAAPVSDSVPTLGWVLQRLIRDEGLYVPPMPSLR